MSMPSLMDGTYFVSKSDLLQFINSMLGLNLQKIEQTANGSIACQLLDAIRPGMLLLSKVDFNATSEYEMIGNYKILQAAFNKAGIDKQIEIARLMKGKPLDNMEFMQWMKAYVDGQTGGMPISNYDGPGRRAESRTGDIRGVGTARRRPSFKSSNGQPVKTGGGGGGGGGANRRLSQSRTSPAVTRSPRVSNAAAATSPASDQVTDREPPSTPTDAQQSACSPASPASKSTSPTVSPIKASRPQFSVNASAADSPPPAASTEHALQIEKQVLELEAAVETAGKERDFYFSKLRDIEILCQTPGLGQSQVIRVVEQILYAQNDEDAKHIIAEAQLSLVASMSLSDNGSV